MLNRAVAVGHVSGAAAGLAETERVAAVLGDRQQWHAVRASSNWAVSSQPLATLTRLRPNAPLR